MGMVASGARVRATTPVFIPIARERNPMRRFIPAFTAVAALLPLTSQAALVNLKINVENLAPTNSVSFAPLRVGLHNGTFAR